MSMQDWPLMSGNYTVFNSDANIAILVPGDTEVEVPEKIRDKIAIMGNCMTTQGLERVIINTLSNPNIRVFLIVGKDVTGFSPAQALEALHKEGIDDKNRVIGATCPRNKLSTLTKEVIEEFRQQIQKIKILDTSSLENEVNQITSEKFVPYKSKIDLKKLASAKSKVPVQTVVPSSHQIEATTIFEAWYKILQSILYGGKDLKSEYGGSKEIVNLLTTVYDPYTEKEIRGFDMPEKELEDYFNHFISPTKGAFEYTYGERIMNWGHQILSTNAKDGKGGIDQLEQVIKRLKRSPRSRRGVIGLWLPPLDGDKIADTPCFIALQFLVRDGKTYLNTVLRSNDMYSGWPANAYALAKLNEYVAEKLGLKPGRITTLSMSGHVYEHNYENVKEFLEKNRKYMISSKLIEDPFGYFVITIDKNRIIVELYDDSGEKKKRFEGEGTKELLKEILLSDVVSLKSHAAYLGRELMRAEYALKNNLEYKQDKE